MTPENALIYRRVFSVDDDRVVVEEKWDLSHPDCPFIRGHWHKYANPFDSPYVRQVVMTQAEFGASNIPLKGCSS